MPENSIDHIDFEDLKQKAEEHSQNLAALMITYPSTHGVFEEKIIEINNQPKIKDIMLLVSLTLNSQQPATLPLLLLSWRITKYKSAAILNLKNWSSCCFLPSN